MGTAALNVLETFPPLRGILNFEGHQSKGAPAAEVPSLASHCTKRVCFFPWMNGEAESRGSATKRGVNALKRGLRMELMMACWENITQHKRETWGQGAREHAQFLFLEGKR